MSASAKEMDSTLTTHGFVYGDSTILPRQNSCLRVILAKPDGTTQWHEYDMNDAVVCILPNHPVSSG